MTLTNQEILHRLPRDSHITEMFPLDIEAPDDEQLINHVAIYYDHGYCVYPVINDQYGKSVRTHSKEDAADLVAALLRTLVP